MMLEEMRDRIAYPLTRPAPNPGMTPMEMAEEEMKRHKMRVGAVPPSTDEQAVHRLKKLDAIVDTLNARGPLICSQIAKAINIAPDTCRKHCASLIEEGRVAISPRNGNAWRIYSSTGEP